MFKKGTKKSFVALAIMMSLVSVAGCTQPNIPAQNKEEQIDTSKTQIYVYNFYGGYGADWLTALKQRFEEAHKDDEWEKGKKGVQIYINNQKESITGISGQILDSRDEVYFTEYAYYYTLKSEGVLGDITSAVTDTLDEYGESGSIESKLSSYQKEYYGVKENGETKYYGLPHYAGYSGLVYNIDLFDEEGWYFAEEPSDETVEGQFIDKYNTVKSAGPDGKKGTSDDGLPTTYEEFFTLCAFIKSNGATPVAWNGANYKHYLDNLVQALVADHEGLEQMMLNYTLDGTATNLCKVENGKMEAIADETITDKNGYLLVQQEGKYYALDFLYDLVTNSDYHNKLAFNGGYSHINAQQDYLWAGKDGKTKPIAMLCDGVWWEAEASATFDAMVAAKGEAYSKEKRNFGWMPLPKATKAKAEETAASDKKYTLYDANYSICFMKSNVEEWKKPLLLEFMKFCHTDESLREFTTITDTPKAFDYTLTETDKGKMTTFGKTVVEMREISDVVYPYSTNPTYANNQTFFTTHYSFWSTINGTNNQWVSEKMKDDKITPENWIKGMLTYYTKQWSTL